MAKVPTMKVRHIQGYECIINTSDFDSKIYESLEEVEEQVTEEADDKPSKRRPRIPE